MPQRGKLFGIGFVVIRLIIYTMFKKAGAGERDGASGDVQME